MAVGLPLLLLPAVLWGQGEGVPVVVGRQYTIASRVLQEQRSFFVGLPEDYERTADRYPVLYVLDGQERVFHGVTGTVRTLASQGRIPPLIVVAVPLPRRTRDLTPPTADRGGGVPPDAGGADRFLQFLREELIPHVGARFRTAPYRTLSGVSFGGLFAVHALYQRPAAFSAYLAISPSLWWNDQGAVKALHGFLRSSEADAKQLVITLANEGAQMRTPVEAFTAILRGAAPPGFAWEYLEFPEERHETVALRATYAGLLAIFSDWGFPDDSLGIGVDALERHHRRRAAKYGVSADVPAGGFFEQGRQLLDRGEPAKALEAFQRSAVQDPRYPLAYLGLGLAQERLGRLEAAVGNLETAAGLADSVRHPLLEYIRQELARVEARRRSRP